MSFDIKQLLIGNGVPKDKARMMAEMIESERDRLQSELESLKRERAMLVEAFLELLRMSDREHDAWDNAYAAISATSEQSAQWLEEKKALWCEELQHKYGGGFLLDEASELRLAASKRKE